MRHKTQDTTRPYALKGQDIRAQWQRLGHRRTPILSHSPATQRHCGLDPQSPRLSNRTEFLLPLFWRGQGEESPPNDENEGLKNQIMLPFQGENGLAIFLTQGDAIGLRYSALSGRRRLGVFSALKGQYTPAQRQRLGRKWNAVFSALKGQYNPAQRQRLGRKWNAVFSALKGQYTPAQRQRLGRKWNIFYSINQLINQSINWIRAIYPSPTATPWEINNEFGWTDIGMEDRNEIPHYVRNDERLRGKRGRKLAAQPPIFSLTINIVRCHSDRREESLSVICGQKTLNFEH